ncbi:hypothetical protein B0I21_11382 [Sphingobacterium paludis]|uniref:Uncharacterized protein n=2 Tax=Sphingobacterium paludis TaxID=1476465 RepID=A0A4R7CUS8_9SPHI|nr:hypothetical protein B0I21_11382 [Sphingobacterium paludis]
MLISCSDNDVDPTEKLEECRVSNINLNGEIISYTYDAEGKISAYDVKTENYSEQGTMIYNNGAIVVKGSYLEVGSSGGQYERIYNLNSSNQITSSNRGRRFEYNADGFLTKVYLRNTSDNYYSLTYNNGNLVKEQAYENGKATDYISRFEYSNDPYFLFNLSAIGRRMTVVFLEYDEMALQEQGYFGKISKNKVKSIDGSPVTYSTDSQGKISSLEYKYHSDKNIVSFNRSCK